MQQHTRQNEAAGKGQGLAMQFHAVGRAVCYAEHGDGDRSQPNRGLKAEGYGAAEQHDRGEDHRLHRRHHKPALRHGKARGHRHDEGGRPGQHRAPAAQGRPEPDRQHRQHMIEPCEGVAQP